MKWNGGSTCAVLTDSVFLQRNPTIFFASAWETVETMDKWGILWNLHSQPIKWSRRKAQIMLPVLRNEYLFKNRPVRVWFWKWDGELRKGFIKWLLWQCAEFMLQLGLGNVCHLVYELLSVFQTIELEFCSFWEMSKTQKACALLAWKRSDGDSMSAGCMLEFIVVGNSGGSRRTVLYKKGVFEFL